LEPVSLVIKMGRIQWLGHIEYKDNVDWVKQQGVGELDGGNARVKWHCVKNDIKSFGQSRKDAYDKDD